MSLEILVPGQLWHAQQALRFGPLALSSRMTVMRRQDGTLWVHSPILPTPALRSALGYVAPGLAGKRPDLATFPTVDAAAAEVCGAEVQSVFVEGLPVLDETVWFHKPSGTLIVTDLLFCFGRNGWAARALGVLDRLAMSRTMRWMVRDRVALRRSVERILALEVRRVVLAHDQIVEVDVRDRLLRSFAWLAPRV